MRKLSLLFITVFCISQVYSQHQVNFTFEDAYSFERIEGAYILVENTNSKSSVYQSDGHGVVSIIDLEDNVSITIDAVNYYPLKSHFLIDKSMDINFVLQPRKKLRNHAKIDKNFLLIDGILKDRTNGTAIEKAKVDFPELGIHCLTNASGKFQLKKKNIKNYELWSEGDSLTMIVTANGYEQSVVGLRFSHVCETKGIFLNPLLAMDGQPSLAIQDSKLEKRIKEKFQEYERQVLMGNCGNLPTSIRVGTNCSCNTCSTVEVMELETYVQKGLDDEWISSWDMESLKAGSLPYKTFGAYYVLHPIDSNYDISNTTCKQVWESDYATSCVNAAIETQGEYLVTGDNAIAFSEYSAENNGLDAPSGEGCGDGFSGTGSSYPCISDNVCAGHSRFGHGRGMCQWGSQRWAQQGKDYQWIVDHYYNPAEIYRCEGSGMLDCSNAIELGCGVTYYGNSSSAVSNITYYGCNNWTETGPERVHVITPLADGIITATLSNFTGDLDVYILGSCDPDDCLGIVNSSDAIYNDAQAGHTYYIVVDADDGSSSSYDLMVECPSSEDLFVANFSIGEAYINSGETVLAECDYVYSGSVSSSSLPFFNLGYYLSNDHLLDDSDILLGVDSAELGVENPIQFLSESLQIPLDTDTGNYYILFVADLNEELSESSEGNNIKSTAVFVNQHESVETLLLEEKIKLYPNPTKGVFNLESDEVSIVKIELYNCFGQLLKEIPPKQNIEINIVDFKKGLYFLKIMSTNDESATLKLIKD